MQDSRSERVRRYFDDLASGHLTGFHHAYYCRRIELALSSCQTGGKKILDVGAGTGLLYDRLSPGTDYLACDLSGKMLDRSRIPYSQRRCGRLEDMAFPAESFDFIFALGMSAYLGRDELERNLHLSRDLLREGGQLIISFTHAASWESRVRKVLRRYGRHFAVGRWLLAQDFETLAYTPEEIERIRPSNLRLVRCCWLSQSPYPANRLFPHLSFRLMDRVFPKINGSQVGKWLSPDFILFFEKEG
ncbi:MAG: methyltransferase domain-containing protein [Saprospiraceae bacterium]|nr:methyltransferase domain-containing protein [Saprospiraceae bacterium]